MRTVEFAQVGHLRYTARLAVSTDYARRRMEIDVNAVVLATRVYAALRERFFIGNAPRDSAEADGGEVLAAISGAIVGYLEEQIGES